MLRRFVLFCWWFVLLCEETAIASVSWLGRGENSTLVNFWLRLLMSWDSSDPFARSLQPTLSTSLPTHLLDTNSYQTNCTDLIQFDLLPPLLWKIHPASFVKLHKPCTIWQLGTSIIYKHTICNGSYKCLRLTANIPTPPSTKSSDQIVSDQYKLTLMTHTSCQHTNTPPINSNQEFHPNCIQSIHFDFV